MKIIEIGFYGMLECGSYVYASVKVPEDYTMNLLVKAIKERGFKSFMTNNMKIMVEI